MTISDEDLEKKRVELDKLRTQLAEVEATREERERDLTRQIEMSQLNTEEARLRAALAQAREASRVGAVKQGASNILDASAEQEKAAVAAATAASPSKE